jgi:hypothetical protein
MIAACTAANCTTCAAGSATACATCQAGYTLANAQCILSELTCDLLSCDLDYSFFVSGCATMQHARGISTDYMILLVVG